MKNSFNIFPGYDYVGIVTDTNNRYWQIGETKLLIKKTSNRNTYLISYFDDQAALTKSQVGSILTIETDTKAHITLNNVNLLLLRTYPLLNSTKLPNTNSAILSMYDGLLNCVVVVRNSSGGMGSGFFITADGYIITNDHVVKRDKTVSITLRNGKTILGDVLSTDKDKDLALIKVDGNHYPWLTLGKLTDARVGEDVIAIGAPEGYDWSVSKGIVSAIRNEKYRVEIQTDAAINHGNSGGPLISLKNGSVIGVNTVGIRKDIAEGLNFAVSAEEIIKAFPQIQK